MEKINSEELKKLLGANALSDDELERVAGGGSMDACWEAAYNEMVACVNDNPLGTQDHHEQCMQAYNMKLASISKDPACR